MFLKLTAAAGGATILVNFEHVRSICVSGAKDNSTSLTFPEQDQWVCVRESVEEIESRLRNAGWCL